MRVKIFSLLILVNGLFAKEPHLLSVCAIFKNETPYLKEWIEYHRLIGIDHFYLYNNNSTDRPAFVLKPYLLQKIVTLIPWPDNVKESDRSFVWPLSTQVTAYENAIKMKGSETKWMVFLDIDEFLVPVDGPDLRSMLEKYEDAPGIVLSRDYFDAAWADAIPPRHLVIEAVEKTKGPETVLPRSVAKLIFQPKFCTHYSWPPYECKFAKGQQPIKLSKKVLRINRYVNRERGPVHSERSPAKIALHRPLFEEEMDEWIALGYEVEDQERAVYRFVPEVLRRLGY
jgi:hypothetical protein